MSITENSTPQVSPDALVGSFNEYGDFISHPDWVAPGERTASTAAEEIDRTSRSPTPEWYYNPSGLNHLNPSGIRSGASYPALQTSRSQSTIARDSIDGTNDKPRKRDRLASSAERIMTTVRRLIRSNAGSPVIYPCTQSETALDYYPLTVDLEESLTDYWETTCYAPAPDQTPASRPRNFSAPPVLRNRDCHRMRWWQPSGPKAGPSNAAQSDDSAPASDGGDMSTPDSPVTQVPASPRLVGDVMDAELDAQMADLAI